MDLKRQIKRSRSAQILNYEEYLTQQKQLLIRERYLVNMETFLLNERIQTLEAKINDQKVQTQTI